MNVKDVARANRLPNPGYLIAAGLLAVLFILLYRTAWVCDDAYITFRTVANFVDGHGPVYNVGERVQAYSNPLWMILMSPFFAISGEAYYTSIILSCIFTLAAVRLIAFQLVRTALPATLILALLLVSQAFVDFGTSGLENPLSYYLIAVFALAFFKEKGERKQLFVLTLAAAFITVNRLDMILLVLPPLIYVYRKSALTGKWKLLLLGMLPLVIWELFCLIYYGFPFPNTFYAKLGTGYGFWENLSQGLLYFRETLLHDPVSMVLIVLAIFSSIYHRAWKQIWWMAAVTLYLFLMLRSGGDFMRGRFFSVPVLMAVICLTQLPFRWRREGILAGLMLVLGLVMPDSPVWSGANYHVGRTENPAELYPDGITNERAMAWQLSGLLRPADERFTSIIEVQGKAARATWKGEGNPVRKVMVAIGYEGYRAGPGVYVVDRLALSEPLLARLPALDVNWRRPGHYPRMLPAFYPLADGEQEDPDLVEYAKHLHEITSSEKLFSWDRIRSIFAMNFGAYKHLIDEERYRQGGWRIDGEKFLRDSEQGVGLKLIRNWRPAHIEFAEFMHADSLAFEIIGNQRYAVELRRRKFSYGRLEFAMPDSGSMTFRWQIPEQISGRGFDEIWVWPVDGYADFYLSKLKL